jgi:hypothetical protein
VLEVADSGKTKEHRMTTERTTERGPIACDLTRLPPEARDRLGADLRRTFAAVDELRAIAGGFALRWPPQTEPGLIATLGAIVDYDRLCCPFLGHAIVDEAWGGPVWLHLTAEAEGLRFLATELAALLPREVVARSGLLA